MNKISEADLIINKDGSIYHLNLVPDDLADTVITVGDQDRVGKITRMFNKVHLKKSNREFVTHTGELNGKLISVISTGIGTDNIDIVMNELDALVNIDFATRTVKENQKSLDIIRVGSSGSMQPDLDTGTLLISEFGIGLDGLLLYYDYKMNKKEVALHDSFKSFCDRALKLPMNFYTAMADETLVSRFSDTFVKGITVTCPGFYAPQGRKVRAHNPNTDYLDTLSNFSTGQLRTTNFEMETAGIYGLGSVLGHRCLSCNVLIANRKTGKFSQDPQKDIEKLIDAVMEKIIM